MISWRRRSGEVPRKLIVFIRVLYFASEALSERAVVAVELNGIKTFLKELMIINFLKDLLEHCVTTNILYLAK